MAAPARNYVFTLFFNDDEHLSAAEQAFFLAGALDTVFTDPRIRYAIVNIEVCPDTQRIHWQGYLELTASIRFSALKVSCPLLATAHFESRRGTAEEAIAYCSKSESRHPDAAGPYIFGSRQSSGQGARTDLHEVADAIRAGKSLREIAEEFPVQFMRYASGISTLFATLSAQPAAETDFQPRPWQQDIITRISQDPDDRKIIWVTDRSGNQGKTRLVTHLVRNHQAVRLSGRMADMCYAFSMQPARIVCFDITRAAADSSDHLYSMGEQLKSGSIFSTKYQSRTIHFSPPHVIYFSNDTWKRDKFSHDRIIEIELQGNTFRTVQP